MAMAGVDELARERATANFDVNSMKVFLAGGKEELQIGHPNGKHGCR